MSYVNITLDTTGPSSPNISIESNMEFATQQLVTCAISVSDTNTSGYQMKIWGSVDTSYNNAIQSTEATSQWASFEATKQIKLSATDGSKTIYLKVRDDVLNESSQASDTITLDTTAAVVTITGPDVSRISKISPKNVASFSFRSDKLFVEYKVKVVSSTGASHDTGVQLATTNGSTNVSGTGQTFDTSVTPINVTVNASDLEIASTGDGDKIIKVFVRDESGKWSA